MRQKLYEFLKEYDGEIKIGADGGSSFYYCGTTADLMENMLTYEGLLHKYAEDRVKAAKKNLADVARKNPTPLDYIIKYPDGDAEGFLHFVNMWLKEYKIKTKTLKDAQERLKNYKTMLMREVMAVRDATAYDTGKIVILDGYETGAYWTQDEVTDSRMKFKADTEVEDEKE